MPTPLPPHVETVLYHAVGRVVTRWGFIDALLADACRRLFETLGGHSSQKQPPQPLSKRLEYIGKCFRNKPVLFEYAEFMEQVCQTIKDIDVHRSFLVHGCLTEYYPGREIFQFTKLNPKDDKSGYDQWSMDLTIEDLHQVSEASKQVIAALTDMGERLDGIARVNKGE